MSHRTVAISDDLLLWCLVALDQCKNAPGMSIPVADRLELTHIVLASVYRTLTTRHWSDDYEKYLEDNTNGTET